VNTPLLTHTRPTLFLDPTHAQNTARALSYVQFFKQNYDQICWNILSLIHHDSHRLEAPEDWTDRKLGGPGAGDFFQEVQKLDAAFYHGQQQQVVEVEGPNAF